MPFDYDVTIHPIPNPSGKTTAFARLEIKWDNDQSVVMNGFKIVEGANGAFVSPPQSKGKKVDENGSPIYYDDIRFLGTKGEGEFRTALQDEVYKLMIQKYKELSAHNSRGQAASAQATHGNQQYTGSKPSMMGGGEPRLW